jgi:hypothetical protein
VARRKGEKAATGWNPRMMGLVLCAFFILGVLTGFSSRGREATLRISRFLSSFTAQLSQAVAHRDGAVADFGVALRALGIDNGFGPRAKARPIAAAGQDGAIAMVERGTEFYALYATGELRGPVSPGAEEDLPILSGPGAQDARGAALVDWTAVLVRSEADLSHLISEMSIDDDGTAALYLDRTRTEILIDVDNAPLEVARAAEVLRRWHGRERMIEAIDVTTPGQAVVRLAGVDASVLGRGEAVRKISEQTGTRPQRRNR